MKKKTVIGVIIGIWAVCGLGILGYFGIRVLKDKQTEKKRTKVVSQMVQDIKVEPQSTFVVDLDALPVQGDADEEMIDVDDYEDATVSLPEISFDLDIHPTTPTEPDNGADDDSYTLTSYGTINIPSIECEIPIWEGAGKIELRYGAGRMPMSCEAGEVGNFVLFGHRMRAYGKMFNRLGEVQLGDSIIITSGKGTVTYIVDQIETIEPSQLSEYIDTNDGRARITVITCTPTGVGSHRLLVIGHAT